MGSKIARLSRRASLIVDISSRTVQFRIGIVLVTTETVNRGKENLYEINYFLDNYSK